MRVTASYLEKLAKQWQTAYMAANDKEAPTVMWSNGWFIIESRRYRRATLEKMRDTLRERRLPLSSQLPSNKR